MSATTIGAYWSLIKTVIMPLGIMKFVLIAVSIVYLLILIAGWFWKGHLGGTAPLLLAMAFLYFLLILIVLPSQAIATISSKSLRYLTDFRKFYFVVAVILSMILPLTVIIFKLIVAEPAKEICAEGDCTQLKSIADSVGFLYLSHFGLQVWLLSTAFIIALFFTAYRFPLIQSALFMTFAVVNPILQQLSQWSFLQLISVLVLFWLAFAFWWLRLKPQKYFINYFAINMEQMMAAGTTANPSVNPAAIAVTNFLAPRSKPNSFLGTKLMGMSDGYASLLPSGLMIMLMTLLVLVLFKWLMADKFQNMMQYLGVIFVFYTAIFGSFGFLTAIIRNIKSLWLLFPGDRRQLFCFIEKHHLKYSLQMMFVTPLVALALNQIAGVQIIGVSDFVISFVVALIIEVATFYFSMIVYVRDKDNKIGATGWQAVIAFGSIILFSLACTLWNVERSAEVVVILLVLVVAILLSRYYLLKKWQKINFVRVG